MVGQALMLVWECEKEEFLFLVLIQYPSNEKDRENVRRMNWMLVGGR